MSVALSNIRIGSRVLFIILWLITILLSIKPRYTSANPNGGSVVEGRATISSNGNRLNIDQSSHKAVIDWKSFNISKSEHTHFNQPSSSSISLNRVIGKQLSNIDGGLSANGQIFLLNPNGIIFGANAQVEVGGLVATTKELRNDDFMRGYYHFNQKPDNQNSIVNNLGQITVNDGGSVVLAASSVSNEGVIKARRASQKWKFNHRYALFERQDQVTYLQVYCLGIKVKEGMVCLADGRITSGNQVSSARKVSLFSADASQVCIMTSGLRSLRDKAIAYFEDDCELEKNAHPERMLDLLNIYSKALRLVKTEDKELAAQIAQNHVKEWVRA